MDKQSEEYKDLAARIAALERAVFGASAKPGAKAHAAASSSKDFKGATGGLRLVVSQGFFDRRRKFSEIEAELNKQGNHYSKQAIQTPLNRLSAKGGPLVGLKEQGRKVYVKRK
jgi:hypothetical protein